MLQRNTSALSRGPALCRELGGTPATRRRPNSGVRTLRLTPSESWAMSPCRLNAVAPTQ